MNIVLVSLTDTASIVASIAKKQSAKTKYVSIASCSIGWVIHQDAPSNSFEDVCVA